MTLLRKHSGKRVFPLADTLRFLTFPSQRLQRNRNTFFTCFRQISVSGITYFRNRYVCLCCGNSKFRNGNLLFRSFYRRKGEDTVPQPDLCFRPFPLLRKYVQKVSYLRKPGFPIGIFLYSYMNLTFEYFP